MSYANSENWLNAFSAANACFSAIRTIHMLYFDMHAPSWNFNHFFSCIYWANQSGAAPEPYELTMDDIIQTMLVADPNQVEYFIGLVDAYRVSIWDRPFNQEFFAALSRGFKLWP